MSRHKMARLCTHVYELVNGIVLRALKNDNIWYVTVNDVCHASIGRDYVKYVNKIQIKGEEIAVISVDDIPKITFRTVDDYRKRLISRNRTSNLFERMSKMKRCNIIEKPRMEVVSLDLNVTVEEELDKAREQIEKLSQDRHTLNMKRKSLENELDKARVEIEKLNTKRKSLKDTLAEVDSLIKGNDYQMDMERQKIRKLI